MLTDYVVVNITQQSVSLTRPSFGTSLLLSYNAPFANRVRTYGQLSDVAADFPHTTGPEYLAAQAYFAQSPSPTQFKIGRGAQKPTKTVLLSAISPTGFPNHTYTLHVKGDGFASVDVTFTSGGAPTDAAYAAGIVAALNAVPGKNYTASGAASPVQILGNSAGAWFSVEVDDITDQRLHETTGDPGIATDLTAIAAEDNNWFTLLTTYNSTAYGTGAAAWVESASLKMYVADTNDTGSVLDASTGTNDFMDQAKTNAYTRTMVAYHKNAAAMMAAAWCGRTLPFSPGSETWDLKTLATVSSYPMTSTQRANIIARNGNGYENVAGLNVTFVGQCANGGFFDTRRFLDWLQSTMALNVFGALAAGAPGLGKVPYTDPGIAIVEAQVRGTLKQGADAGGIIESTILVTVPLRANVPSADIVSRTLNNVKFSATLAGAIHKTVINGSVS